jgi:hypothetical protein
MTAGPQQDKAKKKMLVLVMLITYFCHTMPVENRKIQLQQIGGQV